MSAIWDVTMDGVHYNSTEEIQREVVKHFEGFLMAREEPIFEEQLWGVQNFPIMFTDNDNRAMGKVVSKAKVEGVLRSFAWDKSPSLDGWNPNFFIPPTFLEQVAYA